MSDELYSIDEFDEQKDARHEGVKRRSGRFPYGSGKNPYQHERDFIGRIRKMRDDGMSDKDIATAMGFLDKDGEGHIHTLREKERIAKQLVKKADMQQVWNLYYKQPDNLSVESIAKKMNISTGTVRNYINPDYAEKYREKERPLNMLRDEVKKKKFVDVGPGAASVLGVAKDNLRHELIPKLQEEGFEYHKLRVKQLGTNNSTEMQVLAVKGTTKKELYQHIEEIMPLGQFTIVQNGETKLGMLPPVPVDHKRVMVNYADTGTGGEKDGVIEIRRGVDDLSLHKAAYAQVRISVDGTHYLKGMAVYRDGKDMPDGVDIIFNTNKKADTPMMGPDNDHSVLKCMKADKDNPFGATIMQDRDLKMCQQFYKDKNGVEHQSAVNVVTEEGKWDTWSRTLASQFLSKQHPDVAKSQLNLAANKKRLEFEQICNLTNPTLKKKILEEFASGCDHDAVTLKAAALPRQTSKVLLPVTSLKDNEIYAPGYKDGETLCLIRYPHGGLFEIPTLKVNNSNKEARKVLGTTPSDCIGINAHVAQQLSGADFDGDTAVVIPVRDSRGRKIVGINTIDRTDKSYPKELLEFDTKQYKLPDGVPGINGRRKNQEMGICTNLITDMTLQGAPIEDIVRATKHSMVIIDSEKHHLDIAKSARENNIAELHQKYQGKAKGGAYTLISKASSQYHDDEKHGYYKIDKETGEKIERNTDRVHLQANKPFKQMSDEEKLAYNKAQSKYNHALTEYNKEVRMKAKLDAEGKDSSHLNPKFPEAPDSVEVGRTLVATKSIKKMTATELKTLEKAQAQYKATGKVPDSIGGLKFKEKPQVLTFKVERNTIKTTKMAATPDATSLISPGRYTMELIYANYANSMKSLANQARKEMVNTPNIPKSTSAAKTYAPEIASLESKLALAESNKPRERMAQRAANSEVRAILNEHPEYKDDSDKLKKIKNQALSSARSRYGSQKKETLIHPTANEWKAIQSGAFSAEKLKSIFDNCDSDELKQLATPKRDSKSRLSSAEINLIKSMRNSGAVKYTLEQIAEQVGVSTSTVSAILREA